MRCPLTEQIRYVGYSKDPEQRLWVHMHQNGGDSNREWIESLKVLDLEPALVLLEEVPHAECYDAESRWINRLLGERHELVNKIYRGAKRPELSALFEAKRRQRNGA